eukprot:scaffold202848_cov40-Tisochrysis_lutea.AAC.3
MNLVTCNTVSHASCRSGQRRPQPYRRRAGFPRTSMTQLSLISGYCFAGVVVLLGHPVLVSSSAGTLAKLRACGCCCACAQGCPVLTQ